MESEFYEVSLLFEVADTAHNFGQGNLFVQSKFNSYKKQQQSISVARTSFLDPKSDYIQYLKEFLMLLPFNTYMLPASLVKNTHVLQVKMFEEFDNREFGTDSIEFIVTNYQL